MKKRKISGNILGIYDEDNNLILSMTEQISDNTITIALSGAIKNEVAHDFEDEVIAAISVCKNIVLDFSKVIYIASFALRSLLSAQQILDNIVDSSMVLINVHGKALDEFKESGFSDILMIKEQA